MIENRLSKEQIEEHAAVVLGACRRHTNSESAAWDACQDTFLAFSYRRNSLDLTRDIRPWLLETARRCSLAVLRNERRVPTNTEESTLRSYEFDYVDGIFLKEATDVLREEIAKMPTRERELIQLVFVDCIPHRKAAETLGCPAGSLHSKAEQARNTLRERLERRGISLSLLLLLFLLQGQADASLPRLVAAKQEPNFANRERPQKKIFLLLALMLLTALCNMEFYANLASAAIYGQDRRTESLNCAVAYDQTSEVDYIPHANNKTQVSSATGQ